MYRLVPMLFMTCLAFTSQAQDPFFSDASIVAGIHCEPPFVDIDVRNADLQKTLWELAHCAHQSISIDTSITDTVTLHSKHLSFAAALHRLLDHRPFQWRLDGSLWRIVHKEGTKHWHSVQMHHTTAKEAIHYWQQHHLWSHSELMIDPLHNQLWLHIDNSQWREAQRIIHQWDQPVRQVSIHALIVQVDSQTMSTLGHMIHSGSGSTVPVASNHYVPGGVLTFNIARIGMQQLLQATLEAAAESGHGILLASPHLMAMNHHLAQIETGSEIPYTEKTAYGDTSTAFKKAVLKLAVLPHVLDNHQMTLEITLTQDHVKSLEDERTPSIQTRTLKTHALLRDGQTLILGGIEQDNAAEHDWRVPGVSEVPLIGHLFRKNNRAQHHQQLLLLITPRLITSE